MVCRLLKQKKQNGFCMFWFWGWRTVAGEKERSKNGFGFVFGLCRVLGNKRVKVFGFVGSGGKRKKEKQKGSLVWFVFWVTETQKEEKERNEPKMLLVFKLARGVY